jgi:hypothetical protein
MTDENREVATPWRAGCGESRTPGSEGGVEKHSSAVRPAPTLLGKSKMGKKAALQTTFDGQGDRAHTFDEAHSHGIGNCRCDLTNRVCRDEGWRGRQAR